MYKIVFKNILILLSFSSTLYSGIVQAQSSFKNTDKTNSSYEFHYEDIENFRTVLETIKAKGDTLKAIDGYISNGSLGMNGWKNRYGINSERLKRAITFFPEYYNYLSQLDGKLKTFENEIAEGLDGLKKLYPSDYVFIPPVYYFILFGGGGSIEMTANMISIDYFGHHDDINEKEFDRIGGLFPKGNLPLINVDLVPQVVIHETAHLLQSYIQGRLDYVSIYKEDYRSMQAYAIREGGADFLAYLGSGITDERKNTYGDLHEKELWSLFEPILMDNPDKHPGWFSGKSEENPNWPFQIGYYMGFKIAEYFYNTSEDKEKALTLILRSNQNEDFEKFISKYREKWD